MRPHPASAHYQSFQMSWPGASKPLDAGKYISAGSSAGRNLDGQIRLVSLLGDLDQTLGPRAPLPLQHRAAHDGDLPGGVDSQTTMFPSMVRYSPGVSDSFSIAASLNRRGAVSFAPPSCRSSQKVYLLSVPDVNPFTYLFGLNRKNFSPFSKIF